MLIMMVKPVGTNVDRDYQSFNHDWIVYVLWEKWYMQVYFGGNFGATGSNSDWLQNGEIEEGLILLL